MGWFLRIIISLRILNPVLRPLVRFLIGVIAIPVFRMILRRMVRLDELDKELAKDLEQWFRGSLLLLAATANMEEALFGWVPLDLEGEYAWLALGTRLLLAIGVIEAMPDQDLFAIIHPGPAKLLFPKENRWRALREQCWPFCKGLLCRHLDRSSAAFAIMTAIFTGPVGWVCYVVAIIQYLIIGLVTSRDKALDVLSEFDRQVHLRRLELLHLHDQAETNELWNRAPSPLTAAPGSAGLAEAAVEGAVMDAAADGDSTFPNQAASLATVEVTIAPESSPESSRALDAPGAIDPVGG